MTDFGAPEFAVVGCSECGHHWIIADQGEKTTSCPGCERRYRRPGRSNPDDLRQLKSLANADSREDAADLRASILSQRATSPGDAQTFGLDSISRFGEMWGEIEASKDAAAHRLESETGLDDDALERDLLDDFNPEQQHDALRRPGQPQLDSDVTFDPTEDVTLGETTVDEAATMVENAMAPEQLRRANDPVLDRVGETPAFVHEAAADRLADLPDDVGTEDRPEAQDHTGLRLEHRDDIPSTADVVLDDVGPRMREWLGDWTEQALEPTAKTVRDLVEEHAPGALASKRLPRSLKTTLQTDYGITALDGLYVDAISEYAADYAPGVLFGEYNFSMHERRHERLLDTVLGVGTPGADDYRGLDDVVRGPIQTLGYADEPITTIIHLDADAWLDVDDRDTGKRALQTLAAIAESSRVYLSYESLLLLEELAERYGDYLEMAGIDLTQKRDEALSLCVENSTNVSGGDTELVYKWVRDTRDDTQEVRLVKELSRATQGTLTRDEITFNPDVDISENSFYAVKDSLVDAGLVEWQPRSGSDQSSRLTLTSAGELAAAYVTPKYALRDPLRGESSTRLTAHHKSGAGAVGTRDGNSGGLLPSRSGAGRGSAGLDAATTAEDWLAATSAAGFEGDTPQYLHWIDPHDDYPLSAYQMQFRYTAPATKPGVHLVDERIQRWDGNDDLEAGDGRSTFVSNVEKLRDDEFLLMAQVALDPLVTLHRLVNALLHPRVMSHVLSESEVGTEFEKLYDGAWSDIEDVDSIGDLHEVLRDGVQIGYKSADERTVENLRERFAVIRQRLNASIATCVGLEPGHEDRTELFNELHGLVASMSQLLFASGKDLVVNLRVPQTYDLATDELYLSDFLEFLEKTVPKQAVYRTKTGWHSWTRQTQEERPEKLKWRRSPGIDDEYPTAELTASWVLTGPSMTDFLDDVRGAVDAGVRERADGKRAPPALEVPVRDATQPRVLAEVIEELAGDKDYDVANAAVSEFDQHDFNVDEVAIDEDRADDITRLLKVFLGALGSEDRPLSASPHLVAEALMRMNSSSKTSDYLRVRDIEHGIANLSPTAVFPALGPVATSIVQEFLKADEPLLPSEAIERSTSAASTKRTWEEMRKTVLALGIVEERAAGQNEHYTATLEPWWAPSSTRSKPLNVPDSAVSDPQEHEILFEISCALGLDVDDELFAWIEERPDVEDLYDASETLRRWRPLVAAAFVDREDLIDLPPPEEAREVVVLGRYPDGVEEPWYSRDDPRESLASPVYTDSETGSKPTYGD